MPALRRHEVSVSDSTADDGDGKSSRASERREQQQRGRPDVRVDGGPEEGSPRAVVRYRPKLSELQKRLRSRHALQFVVQYDVDRKDVGGEVQVRVESWTNSPHLLDIIHVFLGSQMRYARAGSRNISRPF